MNKPNFTREQIDWISYQIGEWYLHWKHKIANFDDRTHRLGFAKEGLKMLICGDEYNKEELTTCEHSGIVFDKSGKVRDFT